FHLEKDITKLENQLDQWPETRMIIVDPITAYLCGVDTHKTSDVRSVLGPLADMAARRRIAVVCVSHLNKNPTGAAINRVTGSGAFVAAVRAAFIVAKDQVDESRRLLVPAKNNNAEDIGGLAFRIEECVIPGGERDIVTSRVVWEGNPVRITAD